MKRPDIKIAFGQIFDSRKAQGKLLELKESFLSFPELKESSRKAPRSFIEFENCLYYASIDNIK